MKTYSCAVQLMRRVVVLADSEDEARYKLIEEYVTKYPHFDVFADRNDVELMLNNEQTKEVLS